MSSKGGVRGFPFSQQVVNGLLYSSTRRPPIAALRQQLVVSCILMSKVGDHRKADCLLIKRLGGSRLADSSTVLETGMFGYLPFPIRRASREKLSYPRSKQIQIATVRVLSAGDLP